LIGDGPLRSDLTALALALGILDSVEFRGWCPPERLGEVLGDAWCVVCPSIWAEPFGMAAVEANLLGIPVVASDTGGFLETIEEGLNGILFRTGDVSSLAEKLRSIAAGAMFPARRLSRQTVAGTRARFGMKVHATRVREVLAAITEAPSH
jgi:glycosyltransferase involved in cell wall biosynthesis